MTGMALDEEKKKKAAGGRITGCIRKDWLFLLLLAGLLIYYIWRLFAIPPWYDELYTYENFIDRGVIYSMIHWPLPNNHVFFSALSAFLNKLGSPYIGLRGVSFLASMGSLILLYRLLKNVCSPALAAAGVALFAAMYNVTGQAVQGRGYALSGFFLLMAVTCLMRICDSGEKEQKGRGLSGLAAEAGKSPVRLIWKRFRYYIGFAAALTGGLYTIASNLYWVVPVCLTGGLYLLLKKNWKRLGKLIGASAAAAAVTFVLYSVIWLAIGSNFLVKEEGGPYFGMGHIQMLAAAPFQAFSRGMSAMLADPNIQSIGREQFNREFFQYLYRVLNQVYPDKAVLLLVLIGIGLAAMLVLCIHSFIKARQYRADQGNRAGCGRTVLLSHRTVYEKRLFLALYCLVLTAFVPFVLWVQCVFPYLRVFTYMGSVLASMFVLTLLTPAFLIGGKREEENRKKDGEEGAPSNGIRSGNRDIGKAVSFLVAIVSILLMCYYNRLPSYNAGYDTRDNHIYAALKELDEGQVESVLTSDVYTSLNLYFHIERCRGKKLVWDGERPDYVLMDKILTTPEGENVVWPFTMTASMLPWDWINGHMEIVFEDEQYIAYQAKAKNG